MTVEQGPEMPPVQGGGPDIGDAPWAEDPQSRAACIDASLKDSKSKPAASVLDVLIRPLGTRLTPTNFTIADEPPAQDDPPAVTPKAALALNLFGSAGFGGVEVQSVTWGGGQTEAAQPADCHPEGERSDEAPQCLADAEPPVCPVARLLTEDQAEAWPPDVAEDDATPAGAPDDPQILAAYDEDLLDEEPLEEGLLEEEGERFYDDLSPEELAVMIGGLNRGCDLGEIEEMLKGGATAPAGDADTFEDTALLLEPQEPEAAPDADPQSYPEAAVGPDNSPIEAEAVADLTSGIDPEPLPPEATAMERDLPQADAAPPLDPAVYGPVEAEPVDAPVEAEPVEEMAPPEEEHGEAAAAPGEPPPGEIEDFTVQSFGLQRQGEAIDLNAGEPGAEPVARAERSAADPVSGAPAAPGAPELRAAEPTEVPGVSQVVAAVDAPPSASPVLDMQRALEAEIADPGFASEGAAGTPPPAAEEASSTHAEARAEAIMAEPPTPPDDDFAGILRSVEDSITAPNSAVSRGETAGQVTTGMQQSLIDEYVKQAKQEAAAAPVKPRKAGPPTLEPERYSPPELPSGRRSADAPASVAGSADPGPPKDGRRLRQALEQSRARAENKKLSEKLRNMLSQD